MCVAKVDVGAPRERGAPQRVETYVTFSVPFMPAAA
jgi:hypothetical protein